MRLWHPPIRDNRSQICTCSVHHVRKISLVRDAITTTSQQAKKSNGRQCKRPMDDHKTEPPRPSHQKRKTKQRQLCDVRGVRVRVVTAEVWQREPMLRFCKLVACWMSNEPCSSTIAHSSHPPHPHFTGICISLSLTLSRACLSHR